MPFKSNINCFNYIILLLLFCLAECIVDPIGNFPLNDDWWYAKTLQHFLDQKSGFISWSSSTQVAQTFTAYLFAIIFGSTFTALRFFTLSFSLISILVFYKLCAKFLLKDHAKALLVSLIFLFNPYFFSLSNSFMTEIPFLTFLILSLYFYFSYKANSSSLYFLLSIFFMCSAILTRQVALAFVIGIFVAELVINKRIFKHMLLFIFAPLISVYIFELWLKNKDVLSAYPFIFSSNGNYTGAVSFDDLLLNVSKRWLHFVSICSLMLSPLLLASVVRSIQTFKISYYSKTIVITLILFIITLISFKNFPIGNYIYDCGFGPDTLYDTYVLGFNKLKNSSFVSFSIISIITIICSFQLIHLMILYFTKMIPAILKPAKHDPLFLALPLSLLFYYLFFCYTSAIFDRYIFIAGFPLLIIVFKEINLDFHKPTFLVFTFLIAIFATLSTKDYLNINRARWEAISDLKNKNKATDMDINGGYEHEGLCFSDKLNWVSKWRNNPPQKYLITHGTIINYKTVSYKIYQRYIPFKKDSLYILERFH